MLRQAKPPGKGEKVFICESSWIEKGQSGSTWYPGLKLWLGTPGFLGVFGHALLPRWGDGAGGWRPLGGQVGGLAETSSTLDHGR